MDFQPAVSIMSVAWLKTEVLRIVTQFYKANAQTHSGEEQGRQDYCRRATEHDRQSLQMPITMPLGRSTKFGYTNITMGRTRATYPALVNIS